MRFHEDLSAYRNRTREFMERSLPDCGGFATREGLENKVAPDGKLRPYFGNTVIFELSGSEVQRLRYMQDILYERCSRYLAERLTDFHITLHDLVSGSERLAVEKEMQEVRPTAQMLISGAVKHYCPDLLRIRAVHVFNMVNTSVVVGFEPLTDGECRMLSDMHGIFQHAVELDYPLTLHATLGYFRPGIYGDEMVRCMDTAFRELEKFMGCTFTLQRGRLVYREFSDMNTYF